MQALERLLFWGRTRLKHATSTPGARVKCTGRLSRRFPSSSSPRQPRPASPAFLPVPISTNASSISMASIDELFKVSEPSMLHTTRQRKPTTDQQVRVSAASANSSPSEIPVCSFWPLPASLPMPSSYALSPPSDIRWLQTSPHPGADKPFLRQTKSTNPHGGTAAAAATHRSKMK